MQEQEQQQEGGDKSRLKLGRLTVGWKGVTVHPLVEVDYPINRCRKYVILGTAVLPLGRSKSMLCT